ncbi:4HBT domain-containing protein [Brevibacillus aydinogluensis]|uniref:4HBT domain-containing protein n=1 Tax=Brevibacillus aydinogluensis TaxID=927786 RepID=A0AA48MBA2_9BACL|nr:4HBT domain-containing protein [Brevibacillus aydinogluensis]
MQAGDVLTWERTFTEQDVREFCRISGDNGAHHVTPDEHGRLVVHGLLTATLPTKIGGDLHVLARNMTFTFLRPVFTGDTIRCEVTITRYERQESRAEIAATAECYNQEGKKYWKARLTGLSGVRKGDSPGWRVSLIGHVIRTIWANVLCWFARTVAA